MPDIDIDLNDTAAAFPDLLDGLEPPGEKTAAAVAEYTFDVRTRVVRRIGTEVWRNPAEAVTWWLGTLENIYALDELSNFHSTPVLAIQQVYLHFLAHTAVPVFGDEVPLHTFWGEGVYRLVDLWRQLSECLREAGLGRELQLSASRIFLPPSETSSWADDVNANLYAHDRQLESRFPQREDYRERLAQEAECQAFGVSVTAVLEQLGNPERLGGSTRLQRWGDWLLLVDLGEQTPPELQQLFRRFMLSRRRLSQQVAPEFLLSPEAPVIRSTAEALAESAQFDWLQYAPVMLGVYGDHDPVAIVSPYLLFRAKVKARTGIARRLVVAENEARRASPDTARAIAALSRQVHAQIEADAATCFREAGMTAVQNVASAHGRPLACGEIDVLAATDTPGRRPVVVVCEVKDTDLSFYKDRGPDEAYDLSKKARQQAQRKAFWVAAHWDKVRTAFGSGIVCEASEACFIALVVPRAASLPVAGPGPASVGLLELPVVARALAEAQSDAWRPDLIRAIVPTT